jgi:two-component system KDP operon response regulator KdpE
MVSHVPREDGPPVALIIAACDYPDVEWFQALAGRGFAVVERTEAVLRAQVPRFKPALVVVVVPPGAPQAEQLVRAAAESAAQWTIAVSPGDGEAAARILSAGADVCLTDASPELFGAQLDALLRRDPGSLAAQSRDEVAAGTARIDLRRRQLFVDGRILRLTPSEFQVMLALVRNNGRVVEMAELLQAIGRDPETERESRRQIRTYVHRINLKLRQHGSDAMQIAVVRGHGYILDYTGAPAGDYTGAPAGDYTGAPAGETPTAGD